MRSCAHTNLFPFSPQKKKQTFAVYTDLLNGEEYFSDAKTVETIMWKDETGEELDTGLVRVVATKQTAGGIKLAGVGGSGAGAAFGGGEKADDDGDGGGDDGEEAEETK